jgi:hypothetical protein
MLQYSMILQEAARATTITRIPNHGIELRFAKGEGMLIPEPLWDAAMQAAQVQDQDHSNL